MAWGIRAAAAAAGALAFVALTAGADLFERLQEAVEVNPESASAWEDLGNFFRRHEQWGEAESSLRRAVALRAPPMQKTLNNLGRTLFHQQDYEEAQQIFAAAVALDPTNAEIHSNLAMALEKTGDLEEAMDSLRSALRIEPGSIKVRNYLGELLMQTHRFQEAEEAFRASLDVAPTVASTNKQLADALLQRAAHEEAIPHLEVAMANDPESEDDEEPVWRQLGYALEFGGRDDEAADLYRGIYQNTSQKVDALWRLSRLEKSRGNVEEAEELLREAIKRKAEAGSYSPRHFRDLGSALFLQGRKEEAVDTWRSVLDRLAGEGKSLVHFNTNFGQNEKEYQTMRDEEDAQFAAHCQDSRQVEEALGGKLLTMLRTVRQMENSSEWLLTWADETTRLFSGGRLISYGVTYFAAWRKVFQKASIRAVVQSFDKPTVLLVGSALGYQCAFALSLGFARCFGYDLLCSSMVETSQKIVQDLGLEDRILLRCADALTAPELTEAAVVWINDDCFPRDFSRALKSRMAQSLPAKSIFVSYKGAELEEPDWQVAKVVTVETSWTDSMFLHVFERKDEQKAEESCSAGKC